MSKKLLLFLSLLIPLLSFGGGYQVNLVGIRYSGMGHIGTSLSLDAGSIFFNPGGLGFIPSKFSFTGGVSGIKSYNLLRYNSPSITEARTDNPLGTPFTLFGAARINDKWSAGIGVYTPFGSAVQWEDDWAGKFLVQRIDLKTILVQPTVSYKISDKIGIGGGIVFAYGKVDFKRALPLSDPSGQQSNVHLKGSTTNWGFNAGLTLKPTEEFSIGFSYRSKINMKVKDGSANFTVPASLSANFPSNTTFNASIPLPANWNLGISYKVSDKFLIGADVNLVQWQAYDSLIFEFNPSTVPSSRSPRKYENTFIFRLGGEYTLCKKLLVRAGAYFDNTPVQKEYFSPETPDSDRIGLSAGLSLMPTERLSIDASFVYINQLKRDATFAPANFGGTYKSVAYIPGIGITYNF
jgi:long-chain fatty acid transport protein